VSDSAVRAATGADAANIGRLLHDFNSEYGDPTPGPDKLAERIERLLAGGDTAVLLADSGPARPHGLAVLRFRPALWSEALECYLAELYVVPAMRGRGLGRALMNAELDFARARGADYMDLREPRVQQPRGQARRSAELLLRTGAVTASSAFGGRCRAGDPRSLPP
jgi:GNAT superfamily N-acetyltransferase